MTTTQEFSLEMTFLPRNQVKDVLRGLLHSIFFHRLLANVIPRELRVLNTTVSITDNIDVEKLIEEKTVEFLHNTTHIKQGKVAILFYEKRLKKNWFQFSKSEEYVCWEQWTITLNLAPSPMTEQVKSNKSVENQFTQNLLRILQIVNEFKEHIPSITTTEGNPFPYQVDYLY
ncbi:autophagy-related protein [Choanephora cucurbitarum]|nr:autophagy-related protein [Choanephora cucurbitarum]